MLLFWGIEWQKITTYCSQIFIFCIENTNISSYGKKEKTTPEHI